MTTFRVRAYMALELRVTGDDGSEEHLDLGGERFLDSTDGREIPVFLDMLDRMSEGLDLPAIRAELVDRGYPAEWWPEED